MSTNIETFAPGVWMEDGSYYEPRGWEWILAFALGGCGWAIKDASTTEFRDRIIDDLKETKREELQKQTDEYLRRVDNLGREMGVLE